MIPHAFRRTARVAAAAAAALATVGLASPAPAAQPSAADGVHSIALHGSGTAQQTLSARRTPAFSMLGITWTDPRAQLGGKAQVRIRDSVTGAWSEWRELDFDVRTPEVGPDSVDADVRAGTQPLWTGPSDGVQVRVTGQHGKLSMLPDGLRVELVDPAGAGDTPAARTAHTSPQSTSSASASMTAAAAAVSTAPQPAVTPRSGWNADESLVKSPPTYTTNTKAVFVHHTAGTNDYTCAQSPEIIRAMFLYHVQSQGWNDIGYHFLVDKCGTLFEGRAGGIDKPVLGAHVYGFNTDTSGVAVLGNYNDALSTPAVQEAVAGVAAWKLGLYGFEASSTVVLTAAADNGKYTKGQKVTLNRISGHRDGYPTECPGNNLYTDLPAIRTLASAAGVSNQRRIC
ncbi:peptidoglycan recognition protein [Streptomyces sp. NPDC051219]|uniref:peptidoglycan recognition protein family protein n=1 Tax=Streptomyces sp. NPDC051219 TaxID=3155283 RepID=UPI00342574CD